jgi:hypothetical protein
MQFKHISIQRARGALFTLFNLTAGLAALLFAVFLRYDKASALRNQVTLALGGDGRATFEHFLAGYGVVICGVVVLSIQYFMSMYDQPKIRKDGTAVNRFRLAVMHWSEWAFSREVRVAVIFGAVYLCCTVGWWEVKEAYFGANGMPPSGHLQLDQIAADVLGVVLAVLHLKMVPTGVSWLIRGERAPWLLPSAQ